MYVISDKGLTFHIIKLFECSFRNLDRYQISIIYLCIPPTFYRNNFIDIEIFRHSCLDYQSILLLLFLLFLHASLHIMQEGIEKNQRYQKSMHCYITLYSIELENQHVYEIKREIIIIISYRHFTLV